MLGAQSVVHLHLQPLLPAVALLSSLVIGGGCFVVILLTTPKEQRLLYVSEGMKANCGLSTIILGTSAHFLALTQYIVAAHVGRSELGVLIAVELCAWYVILSYEQTAREVHITALAIFVLAVQLLHHTLCQTRPYASKAYARLNTVAWACGAFFGVAMLLAADNVGHDLAVSLEYVFLLLVTAQNLCVAHALLYLDSIHLTFAHS